MKFFLGLPDKRLLTFTVRCCSPSCRLRAWNSTLWPVSSSTSQDLPLLMLQRWKCKIIPCCVHACRQLFKQSLLQLKKTIPSKQHQRDVTLPNLIYITNRCQTRGVGMRAHVVCLACMPPCGGRLALYAF